MVFLVKWKCCTRVKNKKTGGYPYCKARGINLIGNRHYCDTHAKQLLKQLEKIQTMKEAMRPLWDPTYKMRKAPETLDEIVGKWGDCLPAVPDVIFKKFIEDNKNNIYNIAKQDRSVVENSVLGKEAARRGISLDFVAA